MIISSELMKLEPFMVELDLASPKKFNNSLSVALYWVILQKNLLLPLDRNLVAKLQMTAIQ